LRQFGIDMLWPFGIFCCPLVYFFQFGMLHQEKSGNPSLLVIHQCTKRPASYVTLGLKVKV
jgi:hypothetical protein